MSNVRCVCGDCPSCRNWQHNFVKRAREAGRCRCGNKNCDCARWEQIFREKFEDPTYYQRGVEVRSFQSPLRDGNHFFPDADRLDIRALDLPSTEPTNWRKRGTEASTDAPRSGN
jgi:hypothetical protein